MALRATATHRRRNELLRRIEKLSDASYHMRNRSGGLGEARGRLQYARGPGNGAFLHRLAGAFLGPGAGSCSVGPLLVIADYLRLGAGSVLAMLLC